MCCVPELGFKSSEIHQSSLFEGLVGPGRPTQLCIMRLFPSLSLLHPWQMSVENSSLITVIYVEMSTFGPSGKISGSVCGIWSGFF